MRLGVWVWGLVSRQSCRLVGWRCQCTQAALQWKQGWEDCGAAWHPCALCVRRRHIRPAPRKWHSWSCRHPSPCAAPCLCQIFTPSPSHTHSQGMMMDAQVRVTPTFIMYRAGNVVHSHVGIKEDKLLQALQVGRPPAPASLEGAAHSPGRPSADASTWLGVETFL